MRIYPLTAVPAVDAPEGHFEPAADGGFDLPGPLADRLHSAHVNKRKQWETEIERQERLHGEDLARRQDPATLYGAVEQLVKLAQLAGGSQTPADGDDTSEKPARRGRGSRASSGSADT